MSNSAAAQMRRDVMDIDLSHASKVFFLLQPLLMRRVQDKVARQMAPGSVVVPVDHRFHDRNPQRLWRKSTFTWCLSVCSQEG